MSEFDIMDVYGIVDDELAARVEIFWAKHNAIVSAIDAKSRIPEVAVVAMKNGELCGVGSVFKVFHEPLGHYFYGFRCFIAADFRRQGLAIELVNSVYANLDTSYSIDGQKKPIGIIVNVQHQGLNQSLSEAVRSRSGLIFVGYDSRGRQIRVRYFRNARIMNRVLEV